MSLINYDCIECGKTHLIPDSKPFSKLCDCYVKLNRGSYGEIVTYDNTEKIKRMQLHAEAEKKIEQYYSSSKVEREAPAKALLPLLLRGGLILLVAVLGVIFYDTYLTSDKSSSNESVAIPEVNANGKTGQNLVSIYSGSCTMYSLTLVKPNQKKYTPVKTSLAK
ncbi:MAG: hypothetical protein EOO92_15390, partial [Pedobacter sp.]